MRVCLVSVLSGTDELNQAFKRASFAIISCRVNDVEYVCPSIGAMSSCGMAHPCSSKPGYPSFSGIHLGGMLEYGGRSLGRPLKDLEKHILERMKC